MQVVGLGAAAALAAGLPAMAGPFSADDFERLIPADKKLSPQWIKSLYERGARTIYRGAELDKIGMPIGGIGTGQLYLGGDGKLWHWDIFNVTRGTGDANYAHPPQPSSPLDQGFALRIAAAGKSTVRPLDRSGFAEVTFNGEYPIARVEYRDDGLPVAVSLEAFSPFIPLNAADSHLPATVLRFTIKNTGGERIVAELAGWLENAVCLHSGQPGLGTRVNRIVKGEGYTALACSAVASKRAAEERLPIAFADFEGDDYGDWKITGEAFGDAPAGGPMGNDQRISGFQGKGLVNTYRASDQPQGSLLSPEFKIERHFISFLIGGGNHPGETCINLAIDGQTVRTSTGKNSDAMQWDNWDVRELAGKTARIEIVDRQSGGWGHIDIDEIEFRDTPRLPAGKLEDAADFGTMVLAVLGSQADGKAISELLEGNVPADVFGPQTETLGTESSQPFGKRLRGALSRGVSLEPGAQAEITFILAWHFPNLRLDGMTGTVGRYYSKRFNSAAAVTDYVVRNLASLAAQTRLWHDTWYDSTLPYWFLDRTFLNTSILATSTAFWFANGRLYGWEGVGCCAGTCTHVWHYAHAAARIFPELERSAREMADFGVSFDPNTGVIDHRGEHHAGYAADGQAGCILRAYREHQMSADDAFLKRVWPRVKKSLEYMIQQDGDDDGIIAGAQHNTLDSAWWGPVAWLSSLYLAALRAGEEMAREVGDEAFAARARKIFDVGSRKIVELLFNGEYFIHKPDPNHPEAMRSANGCEIDQVFGQSWAFQVGLGRIIDEEHVRKALAALWKYNFTPDVGPFRVANKIGRWYAMPGEAGLIMCTFPKGDGEGVGGKVGDWAAGYFNECMNGFEYQVAGHMIWEGLVEEGLAVTRAIHDRYHAARRNPWNEIECGDHYARSMASYGVFLAAGGYEYHGPKGRLAFAPRLTPENFRAAFTAAEGWGTFSQKRFADAQRETIELRYGKLRVRELAFTLGEKGRAKKVVVQAGGKPIPAKSALEGNRLKIELAADLTLQAGETLHVDIG